MATKRNGKAGPVPGDGSVTRGLGEQDRNRDSRSAVHDADAVGAHFGNCVPHEYNQPRRDGKVG
jgi:hypothetical protein